MQAKFKIVKKSKEGVLISSHKGAEPVKMSWEELKQNYTIQDGIWAIPTQECLDKIEKIYEHVNHAAVAYIMGGGLKGGTPDLTQMFILGSEVEKAMELSGLTRLEVMNLVKKAVNTISNPSLWGSQSRPRHKRTYSEPKPAVPVHTGTAVMADDPSLLALKEKFNSEK